MSISQLESVDINSVTRTSGAFSTAPAALTVVTPERIVRSGAATLPEILRLAPNLQVDQLGASQYIITARGFSGNMGAQNFSNQLLVMIDGRSVYTPLYSGVYWDMQDVVPEDIERIEVVSGPGATMWGANAVNGVINITTKSAADTQGLLAGFSGGNLQQAANLQYGGSLADGVAYRVYARALFNQEPGTSTLAAPYSERSKPQAGFRIDWDAGAQDTITAQGDAFEGWRSALAGPNESYTGRNIELRWNHRWDDGSELKVQSYYDHASRNTPGAGGFWVDMYDLDMQHSFSLGDRHAITWGGGGRISQYDVLGTSTIYFVPPSRSLGLFDAFVQDSVSLASDFTVIGAVKLEADPYSAPTLLPTIRASWNPDEHASLWAAVSRAVRSPTPFDEDIAERLGTTVALNGDRQFESSQLVAYEAGVHLNFGDMTGALSGYYNVYSKLRNIEFTSGPALLNLTWDDKLRGHTAGFEIWATYQVTPRWRVAGTFNLLAEHFDFAPGASGIVGPSQLGDDPANTASLRSYFEIAPGVTWDANLRYVSRLPNPVVPAFAELNTSIGCNVTDDLRLSLSGFNLLHSQHFEFPASEANAVPRSFAVGLQWHP